MNSQTLLNLVQFLQLLLLILHHHQGTEENAKDLDLDQDLNQDQH